MKTARRRSGSLNLLRQPGWLRGTIAAVGVIDLILAVVVLVLPSLALLTLAVILAFALIVNGIELIISGAVAELGLEKSQKLRRMN